MTWYWMMNRPSRKLWADFLKFLKPKGHNIPKHMVYDIKKVSSYKYLLFKKSIKRSENNQKYLNDELQSPRKIETRQKSIDEKKS